MGKKVSTEPGNRPGDLVYAFRVEHGIPVFRRVRVGQIYLTRHGWRFHAKEGSKKLMGFFDDELAKKKWDDLIPKTDALVEGCAKKEFNI